MPNEQVASSHFELCDPVPNKPLAAAAWAVAAMVAALLSGGPGGESLASVNRLDVKDRRDGHVVYSIKVDNDVSLRSAQASLRHDLDTLTVERFCREYGFELPYEDDTQS